MLWIVPKPEHCKDFIYYLQMPEEEAFAVLVKIMMDYRLRELFKPSMAELGLCMFQLECMIQVGEV